MRFTLSSRYLGKRIKEPTTYLCPSWTLEDPDSVFVLFLDSFTLQNGFVQAEILMYSLTAVYKIMENLGFYSMIMSAKIPLLKIE